MREIAHREKIAINLMIPIDALSCNITDISNTTK
jgi:hypothetical protein